QNSSCGFSLFFTYGIFYNVEHCFHLFYCNSCVHAHPDVRLKLSLCTLHRSQSSNRYYFPFPVIQYIAVKDVGKKVFFQKSIDTRSKLPETRCWFYLRCFSQYFKCFSSTLVSVQSIF